MGAPIPSSVERVATWFARLEAIRKHCRDTITPTTPDSLKEFSATTLDTLAPTAPHKEELRRFCNSAFGFLVMDDDLTGNPTFRNFLDRINGRIANLMVGLVRVVVEDQTGTLPDPATTALSTIEALLPTAGNRQALADEIDKCVDKQFVPDASVLLDPPSVKVAAMIEKIFA